MKKLFRYFDQMISPQIGADVKEFLILDYSTSGESLFSTQLYLEKYLKQKKIDLNLKTMALTDGGFSYEINERAQKQEVQRGPK